MSHINHLYIVFSLSSDEEGSNSEEEAGKKEDEEEEGEDNEEEEMVKKLAELKAEEVAELKRYEPLQFFVFSVTLIPHLSYFVLIGASCLKEKQHFTFSFTSLSFCHGCSCRGKPRNCLLLIWQEEEETAEGAAEAERESGAEDGSTGCVHRLH